MNIVVLVKQVPNTTEIVVDKVTGTLIRDNVESIVNPDDLAGIEAALQLKEKLGGKVTVISMGPPQAKGMLRELLAMGCDEAVLVTDMKFAGADTWATSNTLAAVLKKMDFDLIIAGRQAIDGDTAQVGPQTAEKIGLPQITYVSEIISCDGKTIVVRKQWEKDAEEISCPLPCIITTLSEMNKPRYMNMVDLQASFDKEIRIITADEVNLPATHIGLTGSPTKVFKTFNKELTSDTEVLDLPADEAAQAILDLLKDKQIITH